MPMDGKEETTGKRESPPGKMPGSAGMPAVPDIGHASFVKGEHLRSASAIAVLLIFLLSGGVYSRAFGQKPLCSGDGRPHLVMTTGMGKIEIELFEDAAPNTVRRLRELVRGPVFNTDLMDREERAAEVGYYDGLVFDFIKKHNRIVTSERPPGGLVRFPKEIDAAALGLDLDKVEDEGEAVNVIQREILKKYRDTKRRGERTKQLEAWVERWKETYSGDFLVGVSRKEINEALGYEYQEGLASRPVKKGAVVLKPVSARAASPRLILVLADMPQKTGRWMVVGHVVRGLEVADEISLQPLTTPGHIKPRHFTPLSPVVIESVEFVCK
jgi:cyclophilin family peptidyl-prolyl cis-trans isomerase